MMGFFSFTEPVDISAVCQSGQTIVKNRRAWPVGCCCRDYCHEWQLSLLFLPHSVCVVASVWAKLGGGRGGWLYVGFPLCWWQLRFPKTVLMTPKAIMEEAGLTLQQLPGLQDPTEANLKYSATPPLYPPTTTTTTHSHAHTLKHTVSCQSAFPTHTRSAVNQLKWRWRIRTQGGVVSMIHLRVLWC